MKLSIKQFFFIFLVILLLVAANSAYARPRLAVELISFTAMGITTGVELRWETATELGAAAFMLQRGQGGNFTNLTQLVDENGQPYPGGLVEAEGSPTFGAVYIARDLTAVSGQSYTYQLVEVESSNQTTIVGSVTVVAGGDPTPTQIIIGGDSTPTTGTQSTSTAPSTAAAPASTTPSLAQATATTARTIITPTPAVAENQSAPSAPDNSSNTAGNAGNSQPVSPSPTNSGIVEIAQVEPTPESAYPGQTTPPGTESGYPEAIVTPLTIDATETPYPANTFLPEQQSTPTIVGIVGSQTNDAAGNNASTLLTNAGQPAATLASSTGILWLGFLAGLFIFIAAIVGSIVLFVRRRQ
ncbi:MAG: hypothetical protein KJ069_20685 [Anaerolineae bacterium]|nr:hypothetical protein [Anaerolineae bacterium]